MLSGFNTRKYTSTEAVNIIEKIVYEYLKPSGFRKHGRTLHRYVDGDISQVVNFQNGCPQKGVHDVLWVNLGIRVPECAERKLVISEPQKKYYHEYECNIHTRLGYLVDKKDSFYNLKKDPQKIGNDIVKQLKKHVIPVFNILNSRDAILKRREEFAFFDQMNNHLKLLEDAMIMGRKGDKDAASQLFNAYFRQVLEEYNHELEHGKEIYLRKGQHMMYHNTKTDTTETIVAEKSGYMRIYSANRAHLTYLEELADELGIILCSP